MFEKIDPQLILLLTTLAGFIWQAWRENRTRKWATEDRAAATAAIISTAAAEAEATRIRNAVLAENVRLEAANVALKLRNDVVDSARVVHEQTVANANSIRENSLHAAAVIRDEQKQQHELLATKIEETKQAAHDAYKEANHVNLKIEDLNKRLESQQLMADKAQGQAARVGDETLKKVDAMAQNGTAVARNVEHIVTDISERLLPGQEQDIKPNLDSIKKTVEETHAAITHTASENSPKEPKR